MTNTRAESVAPEGAQPTSVWVYPGFHIGLCPHCALGYAGVSPLQGSFTSFQSYFDALALAQLAKFTRQASFLNLKPLQNVVIARH